MEGTAPSVPSLVWTVHQDQGIDEVPRARIRVRIRDRSHAESPITLLYVDLFYVFYLRNDSRTGRSRSATHRPWTSGPDPSVEVRRCLQRLNRWLQADQLESWARRCGFILRRPRKLTALLFVQSAVLLVSQHVVSLSRWAVLLGVLGELRLAKQSLWERMDAGAVNLLKEVLACVLGQSARVGATVREAVGGFSRVLLQDSTTIQLAPKLAAAFPGSSNQCGSKHGQLKIQAIFDLVSQRFLAFSLSGFNRNDQAAASDVVQFLKPGDLVVRDLGYFVLRSMEQIAQAGAFFLSRLRLDTQLWRLGADQPLDLLRELRRLGRLDIQVRVGSSDCRSRLVAVPLPQAVAAERRRRARLNRDRRCRPDSRHLALLGWAIFLTNVPAEKLSALQVAKIYGLRWRIETIFKAWKSHFGLRELPGGSEHQLLATAYARWIFITALIEVLGPLGDTPLQGPGPRRHSLLRLASLLRDFLLVLCAEAWGLRLTKAWCEQCNYHGRYDRRNRLNFVDSAMQLS